MSHTLTATHVEVTRLAGHIGAEIGGVDTGAPLSDEVITIAILGLILDALLRGLLLLADPSRRR